MAEQLTIVPRSRGWRPTSRASAPVPHRAAMLLAALLIVAGLVQQSRASCNAIPSASWIFRGALGTADRPFVGPGDFVELVVRPPLPTQAGCDNNGNAFQASDFDQVVVTFIFTPPQGDRTIVALASDCAGIDGTSCSGVTTHCVQAASQDLVVVQRQNSASKENEMWLDVRLPNTHAWADQVNEESTLSGPVTIAVKNRRWAGNTSLVACEALNARCADLPTAVGAPGTGIKGLQVCIDELYQVDGTCRTASDQVDGTFGHFTALPLPNDYNALCTTPGLDLGVCTGTQTQVRVTTDQAGNLLVPMDWGGILLHGQTGQCSGGSNNGNPCALPGDCAGGTCVGALPIARLLQTKVIVQQGAVTTPIKIPGEAFLASYAPSGLPLPPVFVPQSNPTRTADVSLFGSADAPHTVLRVARRRAVPVCVDGSHASQPCLSATDTCETDAQCTSKLGFRAFACIGGSNDGPSDALPCTGTSDCPNGYTCEPTLQFFACSNGPNDGLPCTGSSDCPAGQCTSTTCTGGTKAGNLCRNDIDCPSGECGPELFDFSGRYDPGTGPVLITRGADTCQAPPDDRVCSIDALDPIPLEGLLGTPDIFALTRSESIIGMAGKDLNGDGDTSDSVLILTDRETGQTLPIGAGGAAGRAVAQIHQPPFTFAGVATENKIVAFLEPEALQGDCTQPANCLLNTDKNGDGDNFDTILRVFRQDGASATDMLGGLPNIAVDAAAVINHRSLVVSQGMAFFRLAEWENVSQRTEPVSSNGGAPAISADGRYVAFASSATDLDPACPDSWGNVFVRNRCVSNGIKVPGCTPTTSCVSINNGGTEGDGGSTFPVISADGRYVAFESAATNLDPACPDSWGNILVRDRCESNGVAVPSCTPSTQCVSVNGSGEEGNAVSSRPAISADGQNVAFQSMAGNLICHPIGCAGNAQPDMFVHNLAGGTEWVSQPRVFPLPPGGGYGASYNPSFSADGRYLTFQSAASNLVPYDTNNADDVFVLTLGTGSVERVSLDSAGMQGNSSSGSPLISADGRYVVFTSLASNLVPGDTNASWDVFVRDRVTGLTERASVSSSGNQGSDNSGTLRGGLAISGDGRYVAFESSAPDLVPDGLPGAYNFFMHDRLTGLTELVSGSTSGSAGSISANGRDVAFAAGPGAMGVYLHGPDPTDGAADLNGDGDIDDAFLEVVDANPSASPPVSPTRLGPADQVAVANGAAAFLQPGPTGETVHFWSKATGTLDLDLAASVVALSNTHIAAIASDAGHTVRVHPAPVPADAGVWTDTGQAGDTVEVCGSAVVFTTLSGHLLRIFVPSPANTVIDTGLPAKEFVCNENLVAFRVQEGQLSPPGCDLNEDGDCLDAVLHTFDLSRQECLTSSWSSPAPIPCLQNTKMAVTPCPFDGCDPRQPYRVFNHTVRFLTVECDQGGSIAYKCQGGFNDGYPCDPSVPVTTPGSCGVGYLCLPTKCQHGADLNHNGNSDDLVIQSYDTDPGVHFIGTVIQGPNAQGDPLAPDPVQDVNGGTVIFNSAGRCVEDLLIACDPNPAPNLGTCPSGSLCEQTGDVHTGHCVKDQGVCTTDANCPAQITCRPDPIVVASADADGDGVPDAVDNCPTVPNPDQTDSDQDGIGDACDLQTCGNNVVEVDEQCDDGNTASGDGCSATCTLEATGGACQEAIATAGTRLFKTRLSAIRSCRNKLNRGVALFFDRAKTQPLTDPADCPNEYAAHKSIVAGGAAARKIVAAPGRGKCTDALVHGLGACADTVNGLITATGDGGCLVTTHASSADTAIGQQYGHVVPRSDMALRNCQSAIAGAGAVYASSYLSAVQGCRNQLNKNQAVFFDRAKTHRLTDPADCAKSYGASRTILWAGRIARTRIATRNWGKCTDALLSGLGACASTVDGLVNAAGTGGCLITGHSAQAGLAIEAEY